MLGRNRKNAAGIAFSTENRLSVFLFFRISTEDTHESGMIPPQKSGFRIHSRHTVYNQTQNALFDSKVHVLIFPKKHTLS